MLNIILTTILVMNIMGTMGTHTSNGVHDANIKAQKDSSAGAREVIGAHIIYTVHEEPASGEVFYMNAYPRTMVTCAVSPVYGNPEALGEVLYYIEAGEEVLARETSRANNGWYMIQPAEWVNLSTCGQE